MWFWCKPISVSSISWQTHMLINSEFLAHLYFSPNRFNARARPKNPFYTKMARADKRVEIVLQIVCECVCVCLCVCFNIPHHQSPHHENKNIIKNRQLLTRTDANNTIMITHMWRFQTNYQNVIFLIGIWRVRCPYIAMLVETLRST